jgi:dTDP-4-amino-4,6-dideoxygalactose transaminase
VQIPLLDIEAQHASLGGELEAAVARVLAHGRFVAGPEVAEFEQEFARYCGADHAVGAASGTAALTLALRAAGIGPGDEVITSAMTFIATVESIVEAGATPVLADPSRDTALLDPDEVAGLVTDRTAAIVVVHLYGQMVDMTGFRRLADRHGLLLVEDAAQAHGAEWLGTRAGAAGDVAAFSFFPGKNLGAVGDAGALTTADGGLAARAAALRDHGRSDKYEHLTLGTNARLDTVQAAVLSCKLPRLDAWNAARREHARSYDAAFADLDEIVPIAVDERATHVYHQYVVRTAQREELRAALRERGIATGVHYPIPLTRQPALAGTVEPDAFPNADALAVEVLSLPVYPELSEPQRDAVIEAVRSSVPVRAG